MISYSTSGNGTQSTLTKLTTCVQLLSTLAMTLINFMMIYPIYPIDLTINYITIILLNTVISINFSELLQNLC